MQIWKKITILLLLAALVTTGTLIYALPQKSFSQNENRVLQGVPELSKESVLNGTFQRELASFFSDHFPARDRLMELGTSIKKLSGRSDIGGAYIGKDHYYFEKVTDSSIEKDRFEGNLKKIENLAKDYPKISFSAMLVPSAGTVLTDKLPKFADYYEAAPLYKTAKELLSSCKVVDPTKALKSEKEQMYYRTDHHWTTKGAYIGYQTLMNGKGKYKNPEFTTVSDEFLGTLYSKTLDKSAIYDKVDIAKVSDKLNVIKDGEQAGVYDMSALKEKDKYKVFFGGNYGQVEMKGGEGKGTLLVLKDSFANSMVPFLTKDYERIIMVDLRFYPGSVKTLLASGEIDNVLVLYEMNNFATDSNIAKLVL